MRGLLGTEGEVFAQFPEIEMQAPGTGPVGIEFREPGRQWRALVGTTGDFRAFGDGSEPNHRQQALSWLVGG